jgi:hypothetical protein
MEELFLEQPSSNQETDAAPITEDMITDPGMQTTGGFEDDGCKNSGQEYGHSFTNLRLWAVGYNS